MSAAATELRTRPPPPLPHSFFEPVQQGAQTDPTARLATWDRLRGLRRDHPDRVTVFSAHDPWEFARVAAPRD